MHYTNNSMLNWNTYSDHRHITLPQRGRESTFSDPGTHSVGARHADWCLPNGPLAPAAALSRSLSSWPWWVGFLSSCNQPPTAGGRGRYLERPGAERWQSAEGEKQQNIRACNTAAQWNSAMLSMRQTFQWIKRIHCFPVNPLTI